MKHTYNSKDRIKSKSFCHVECQAVDGQVKFYDNFIKSFEYLKTISCLTSPIKYASKDYEAILVPADLVLGMSRREPGWFSASWGPATFNDMQFSPASAFAIFGGTELHYDAANKGTGFVKADTIVYVDKANKEWRAQKNLVYHGDDKSRM